MIFKKSYLTLLFLNILLAVLILLLFYLSIVSISFIWLVFPFTSIRLTTVFTIFICFNLVLFLQDKISWRSLYYAILAVIFFLGLYEIIWFQTAARIFNYDPRTFEFIALAGWVLLCVREVYPTKPPKISIYLYFIFVITMILWVATGFSVNNPGVELFSVEGETFNVVSKTAIALAFAIHIGTKKYEDGKRKNSNGLRRRLDS